MRERSADKKRARDLHRQQAPNPKKLSYENIVWLAEVSNLVEKPNLASLL